MHGSGAQLRWRTAATSEPASPRTSCVQTSELCRSYRARVRLRTPGPRSWCLTERPRRTRCESGLESGRAVQRLGVGLAGLVNAHGCSKC